MPGINLTENSWLLALFIVMSGAALLQLLFYWLVFFRVARTSGHKGTKTQRNKNADAPLPPPMAIGSGTSPRNSDTLIPQHPVSVVICARNEYRNLEQNLPLILAQDYPDFEVIVVNHASDDETGSLLMELATTSKRLKVVNLDRDLNFFSGKKFPLSLGIRSAKNEVILLTDADCTPPGNQWISEMASGLADNKSIVLGYSPYKKRKGIVNALIRFDAFQVGMQYLSLAITGMPYMGVGRNLLYRKELFFQNKGFIAHYTIKSGDDDLFINRVANRKNTTVVTTPGSFMWSEPKSSFNQWVLQKRRHFSTGGHYRFKHQLILGLYTLLHLLFWVPLIILLSLKFAWIIILAVLLLKSGSQMVVFGMAMKRLQTKDLIPWIPLLEWGIILINIGIMVANLIRKPVKWK